MRLLAALVGTLALCFASVASADEDPSADPAAYLGLAAKAWNGAVPDCGQPRMLNVRDRSVFGPMEWALSPAGVAEATTRYDQCGILWDNYSRWRLTAYGWCVVVVHEYGHLLGFDHTANRRSVMYENGPWYARVPVCDQYRPTTSPCTLEVSLRDRPWISLCGIPMRRDLLPQPKPQP